MGGRRWWLLMVLAGGVAVSGCSPGIGVLDGLGIEREPVIDRPAVAERNDLLPAGRVFELGALPGPCVFAGGAIPVREAVAELLACAQGVEIVGPAVAVLVGEVSLRLSLGTYEAVYEALVAVLGVAGHTVRSEGTRWVIERGSGAGTGGARWAVREAVLPAEVREALAELYGVRCQGGRWIVCDGTAAAVAGYVGERDELAGSWSSAVRVVDVSGVPGDLLNAALEVAGVEGVVLGDGGGWLVTTSGAAEAVVRGLATAVRGQCGEVEVRLWGPQREDQLAEIEALERWWCGEPEVLGSTVLLRVAVGSERAAAAVAAVRRLGARASGYFVVYTAAGRAAVDLDLRQLLAGVSVGIDVREAAWAYGGGSAGWSSTATVQLPGEVVVQAGGQTVQGTREVTVGLRVEVDGEIVDGEFRGWVQVGDSASADGGVAGSDCAGRVWVGGDPVVLCSDVGVAGSGEAGSEPMRFSVRAGSAVRLVAVGYRSEVWLVRRLRDLLR